MLFAAYVSRQVWVQDENKCIGVCNELGCLLYVLTFMSNIHARSCIPFDATTISCVW